MRKHRQSSRHQIILIDDMDKIVMEEDDADKMKDVPNLVHAPEPGPSLKSSPLRTRHQTILIIGDGTAYTPLPSADSMRALPASSTDIINSGAGVKVA